MKKSMLLLSGIALLVSGCASEVAVAPPPPPPPGPVVAVEVSDQPYYVHGPIWVVGGVRRIWVPGHWGHRHGHRVWIHGFYR